MKLTESGLLRLSCLLTLAAALLLSGCAAFNNQDNAKQLQVYGNSRPSGMIWVTALYPGGKELVAEGTVEVRDDTGDVRQTLELHPEGHVLLRFPPRTNYVDITVTAPDGTTGKDRVERFEAFREARCNILVGC
ncbi:hypothetical protein [Spongorhabdus nitratireducens]